MILESYQLFAVHEPWGWHPRDFAELTDWQIQHEYVEPARKQAEQLDRERKGLPPPPTDAEKSAAASSDAPPRAMMVGIFMSLGMNNQQANAEYDRQMKLNGGG